MKALLALVPLLLLTALAPAQKKDATAGMDRFDFHVADLQLLQLKPVQTEVGISEAQRKRMNQFADVHRSRLQALEETYKKEKRDPATAPKDPRIVGYFLELKTNVMRALTPGQLKRLREISLQRVGLAALTDDVVAEKIGLSKDQLAKVRAAFQDGGKKYATAERAAAAPVLAKYKDKKASSQSEIDALRKAFSGDMASAMGKAQPQLASIKAQAETKMKSVLTAKQLATYQSLLGKPFKPA